MYATSMYATDVYDKPCKLATVQVSGNTFETKQCRNRHEPYETVTT